MRYKVFSDFILLAGLLLFSDACSPKQTPYKMNEEVQLTFGSYGHMLNSSQVFSPDDQWLVYDTRNDPTHIGRNCCIEKVNLKSGEVVKLYSAPGQTIDGPGTGAAAWNPVSNKIIFIHGLFNCSAGNPYGFTRRFGALLNKNDQGRIYPAEARTIREPLIAGALRGGTHAHTWSSDGQWISFTYNDFLIEQLGTHLPERKDLRTIGVMAPARVTVPHETDEDFSGEYFSVVTATVTEAPRHGSDEIEKAFDECWVGKEGYLKKDGTHQKRAVAFQGNVRTTNGLLVTEVFISDIPDDITKANAGLLLQGTQTSRPNVPLGLVQRRLTFTEGNVYPGLQGPRFWLRSSPDGRFIYFLTKDDQGIIQAYEIPTVGGVTRQITHLNESIQSQFNISPDGKTLAVIAGNSIWLIDILKGIATRLTDVSADDTAPVSSVLWSHKGDVLVYNRYVTNDHGRHLQIFKLQLNYGHGLPLTAK